MSLVDEKIAHDLIAVGHRADLSRFRSHVRRLFLNPLGDIAIVVMMLQPFAMKQPRFILLPIIIAVLSAVVARRRWHRSLIRELGERVGIYQLRGESMPSFRARTSTRPTQCRKGDQRWLKN